MISEVLEAAIEATIPAGITHIGLVATTIDGDVLVAQSKKPLYGVYVTFPKKRKMEGHSASHTLAHCAAESLGVRLGETIHESSGQHLVGLYPLPSTWVTRNSSSFFFHALVESPTEMASNESFDFHWRTPEMAVRGFESGQADAKHRDLAVLQTALEQCASPYRRILLMLRELHRMGFERLRAPAYDYPLAWRCPIVPASWTNRGHGGTFDDPMPHLRQWFGETAGYHTYTYSSASQQQPFGWEDMVFAQPRELALRFIKEKREVALCGWGPDPEYVQWFEEMLEQTEPNGIITCAFADYGPGLTDHLYTHYCRNQTVPLPPGGYAQPGELEQMVQRLKEKKSG
jgi:hypothetical protein